MQNEQLFPIRQTRRDFLKITGSAAATLSIAGISPHSALADPVRLGKDYFTFTLEESWGVLPQGMNYGFGCALVVDSKDRIFVTSRSANPCVAIFDNEGKLLETWSKDFSEGVGFTPQQVAATAHGLYWSKEGTDEFLYWTENVSMPKGAAKIGARVYKTDIKGKILYQIGNVDKESATSARFDFTNPTDVAIAPNGDIYVVDGYGSQLVYRFDKNFKHLKTIGGPGKDHGKFNVCHGIWVSTLKSDPEIYIADRANNRIEVYSLDLEYKRTLPDFLLPCCFYQHQGHLYIPELGARVSIIDENDKVVARLGDGRKVDDIRKHPDKFATPHALTVDSKGNLYVIEWVDFGRPRKLRLTPKS